MTGTPKGGQNQYQLPLQGTADGRPQAPRRARPAPTGKQKLTTNRRPGTTERRAHPAPAAAPRRSYPYDDQNWRLDEKTRRAGRQGVAAARAALAGTARTGTDRQADAA
ncbi:MAG TPA: hypothetical protein VIJ09_13235 [Acidimicrobiales bacterium]